MVQNAIETTIKEFLHENEELMIAFRRDLHRFPELSFEEVETTRKVAEKLDAWGVSYRLTEPTGLIAEIVGGKPGKTVALRADMDALSVQELSDDLEYRSTTEGKMHACGHDAHTSMLLAATKALNSVREHIPGTVRLLFQPAEEIAEGAKKMIEQGAIDGIDNVFGIHIWAQGPAGKVSCPVGPSFAAADIFKVHFKGKGGHAATPHLTIDAAVIAGQFITDVQSIVSRKVDPLKPAVVTIGKATIGQRFNVIAEDAYMEGTVRTFHNDIRQTIEDTLRAYAVALAEANGATVEFEYIRMTEPVVNEERTAHLVQRVAEDAFGRNNLYSEPPTMGAEDFGYYMAECTGAFALVGAGNEEKGTTWPHHHGRFNVDEEAMIVGAELYAQYALAYLSQDEF
ncbi:MULTISPECIES: M20 metallopeptidase family protein [unclassified Jeotgalibaca]|uniref:M20 metallopeptidase family protein n=1 Tax=unclassified Jeotgalibaca TaxID=2621505 RepID=UPI003FD16380